MSTDTLSRDAPGRSARLHRPPRSAYVRGIGGLDVLMFGGPVWSVRCGLVALAGPVTDWSAITGLVGVLGGILTGLAATWAKSRSDENRIRVATLEAQNATQAGQIDRAEAKLAEAERRLDALSTGQARTDHTADADRRENKGRGDGHDARANQQDARANQQDARVDRIDDRVDGAGPVESL